MSLFQVSFPVAGEHVDSLEELLFEIDEGRWNIFLDQDTQVGTAAGVYETEKDARSAWKFFGSFFEELLGPLNPTFELLPDTDWKDSYKQHFKAWSFKGLHWVPVWQKGEYELPDGEVVVWLDPGMAFGTGNHETTRLCIEGLIDFLEQPTTRDSDLGSLTCCDAGSGSGILAISAKKLGLGSTVGFDTDADSVRISHENTQLNDLTGEVDFFVGDLVSGFKDQTYNLVFANILAVVLIEFADELIHSVKPGGRLILSGILTIEVNNVEHTFRRQLEQLGVKASFSRQELGEWSAIFIDVA